jgi:hypothetical protein
MQKRAKSIKKINRTLVSLIVGTTAFAGSAALSPYLVSAQTDPAKFNSSENACPPGAYQTESGDPCATSRTIPTVKSNKSSLLDQLVNPFITLMTAIVGIVIAISLVVAAITYSSAAGDPSKVAAAKKRITNSIIALIAYIFTFGLVQWLVPGGII